jgi:hypothetical protein
MAPDPARWAFTGQVRDTGDYGNAECACGHAIRYAFMIRNVDDDRRLSIGSHCIDSSVPGLIAAGATTLANELTAANVANRRRLSAAKRDQEAEDALPQLRRDLKRLRDWLFDTRRLLLARGWSKYDLPPVIYRVGDTPADHEEPAVTAAAIRRRYVATWWKAADVCRELPDLVRLAPTPRQARLQKQLAAAGKRALADENAPNHLTAQFVQAAYREQARGGGRLS